MSKIHELPLHTRLTPDEVLAITKSRAPEKLVVIFYEPDDPNAKVINSAMTRDELLWLSEVLRCQALGIRGPS
jgi:hypothetical protein